MADTKEIDQLTESDRVLLETDFEELYKATPLTNDTRCGYGIFRRKFLQRLANKKAFIFIHGIVGTFCAATNVYFNATISTLEKRYHIPSQNIGFMTSGYECSSIMMVPLMSYIFARKHRPRWIAVGAFTTALYGLSMALLHGIYGPGDDARALTVEYGDNSMFQNNTVNILPLDTLCRVNLTDSVCVEGKKGSIAPQIYIFMVQFLAGIFGPFYDSLGLPYMDDNILNAKTPALMSFGTFLRMLGPTIGLRIAGISTKTYIIPHATPIIKPNDPRWLGAWWMGWLIIGFTLATLAFFLSLFPRELPRAALRRRINIIKEKLLVLPVPAVDVKEVKESFVMCLKRMMRNKVFVLNTLSTTLYFFGMQPYYSFMMKYIELQFRQSTSSASNITSYLNFGVGAFGILGSGLVISKFKPTARTLGAWNVLVGTISVVVMLGYISLGCSSNDNAIITNSKASCMSDCNCEYVKYIPICGVDGNTYISPCHAGCTNIESRNGTKYYSNCECIANQPNKDYEAKQGPCDVDCSKPFLMFLIANCILQFAQYSGRTANFLIGIRTVLPRDKSFSLAIAFTTFSVFAFFPAPIVFGWIFDQTCLVWSKTCSTKGNCWVYDLEKMRVWINVTAALLYGGGVLLDVGVWYLVKQFKIFNDDKTKVVVKELLAK